MPASEYSSEYSSILFPYEADWGRTLANRLHGKQPLFLCVIASTDTALIPGISAAGATTELIAFTAAADAEVLAHGAARCIAGLPCNPLGPPGPALITAAALQLAAIPHVVVSAGCRILPDAPYVNLGASPGGLITDGAAVPCAHDLFDAGKALGRELAEQHDYLVVGESVPGGTTTALALLLALGVPADGRVSSSLGGNAHELKSRVAREALRHHDARTVASDPLAAVATLGDPMQAAVAGIALGAQQIGTPVLLAGGTQMIAVLALIRCLKSMQGDQAGGAPMAVATTRWVVEDPTADAVGLMEDVTGGSAPRPPGSGGAAPRPPGRREGGDGQALAGLHEPLLATSLSFAASRYSGLRRYEEHLVKEGVGAGGAAIAAALAADVSCAALMERVECLYEAILQSAP
jgi:uncharacterized protein (TIGR00303 family)